MFFPYKDDNPTRRPAVVTIALIAVNIVVFLYFRAMGPYGFSRAVFEFGLIPRELWQGNQAGSAAIPPALSLFTSMFMHGGFLHLGGNMLYLWIFGNNVEDYLGPVRFLFFYLGCGLAAAFLHILFNAGSGIPMVGASGAIAGVLAAYYVLYPLARVHVFVFLFFFITTMTVPAWLVIGFWFVLQLLNSLPAMAGPATGGVAYLAHVGGFAAGYLYITRRVSRTRRRAVKVFGGGFR